ncbi:ribbon-helix-helix domain-containing protein [Tardiphaga sp.]|uniref:ribbon-helix-helix domain-containing protein n=1 Tax=Tardiphaga sp. TaxID=1926292 RepID=UPI00352B4CE8
MNSRDCLDEIAAVKGLSIRVLIAQIDARRTSSNLSSEIRAFVLDHNRTEHPPQRD